MAVVTSDFLAGLRTQFRALFAREFKAARAFQGWRNLVIPINVMDETVSYNWFETVPKMQDVTGDTVSIQGLVPDTFSLTNREYQAAIEVDRKAIERDRLGLIMPRIQQLGMEAARHPGELIFNLIKDNAVAFDGSAFFADSRTISDSGTIDNNIAGTKGSGSDYSVNEFQSDLADAVAQMRLFKDDRGRPMNIRGNVVMVPAALEQVAWHTLNRSAGDGVISPTMPVTEDGMFTGSGYRVIVNPYLTDADDWYLFYVGNGMNRPFIFQQEKAPVLESETMPNSRETIVNRKFLYSVYGRYAVGLTDPRFGVKVVNTA